MLENQTTLITILKEVIESNQEKIENLENITTSSVIIYKKELKKLSLGLFVILIGLTLFLVGANIGFLKIAYLIGNSLVLSEYSYLLLPISAILGFYIVQAEPSVKVLTEQIESITGGSIPKKIIMLCLSVGVSLAVLLSLTRVTTGISILWFIIPGYFISIILSFFIPNVFTI